MEYTIWNLPNDFWALQDIFDGIKWNLPEEQTQKEKNLLNAILLKQKKLIELMEE